MYPRVKKVKNDKISAITVNFFTENQGIELDIKLCVGCGICTKVCPKEAICTPPKEGQIRLKTEDLIPEIPDSLKCSYCGTCVYMCPFSALKLKRNDKTIEIDNLELINKKVLPNLDFKLIECDKIQRKAKIYFEGHIDVDWDKCISCMTCVDVCPTGAFYKAEKKKDQPKSPKVSFNSTKCISCGTCEIGCSKSAIKLTIDKVNYSGDYKEIFWPEVVKRLKE